MVKSGQKDGALPAWKEGESAVKCGGNRANERKKRGGATYEKIGAVFAINYAGTQEREKGGGGCASALKKAEEGKGGNVTHKRILR